MAANTSEGVRRIAVAIRFIGLACAVLGIVGAVAILVDGDGLFQAVVSVCSGGVAYGMFWGISWIILGFAQPKV